MESFEIILILLAFAVGIIAIFRRINLPPIIGYLVAGMLIGPGGLHLIPSINEMSFLAEFGVVFLMFTLGLEFSIPRLIAIRGILLGAGGLQVAVCSIVTFGGGLLLGLSPATSFALAAALSLSSTAVVFKQLAEQKEQNTRHGGMAVNILLFQDIAAVLFLIAIPVVAGDTAETSLANTMFISLGKGVGVFIVLALVGQFLLRPLFREVAKAHSTEVFMMAALLVALSAAWLTEAMDLSMALGAFLAGLMLGETEFRHQIEIDIRPFKDVLLGLFFITVGAYLKVDDLRLYWPFILLLLCTLLIVKTIIIMGVAKVIGKLSLRTSLQTGLIISQGGELSFMILTVATTNNIIDSQQRSITISALVLSLVATPILIRYNKKIAKFFIKSKKNSNGNIVNNYKENFQPQQLSEHTAELENHVIMCGFGRVGQILARFLEAEKIPTVALDLDPTRISKTNLAGEHSFFGDARNPAILAAAGLSRARMVVISYADEAAALETLRHVRAMRLDVPVFVRTKNDSNLEAFQKAGATEVVPESLEGSLMLASHLLLTLGVPTAKILFKIRRVHSDRYSIMQGVFHGEEEHNNIEDAKYARKSLHALVVVENSIAAGKRIDEIITEGSQVQVKTITRGETRFPDPAGAMEVQAGDVLVLLAAPEDLSHVEKQITVTSG